MNKRQVIDQIPLFDVLGEHEKAMLCEMMVARVSPRYSIIYSQGEKTDCIYMLAKGSIKIGAINDEGKEIIKHILHPEMIFGEMAIIEDDVHRNYAMTLNDEVSYYTVSVDHFKNLMKTSPQLAFKVLDMIGKRLRRAEDRLESLVFKDARERIIDFLKDNATKRGRQVGFETLFKHSLTQQDIANFTGTSRQTVTSVMNDLRKSNQIYFNRRSILIRDLASLS